MAVLKAPLSPQAAAMPGYQILPGPTAGSVEVDLSTPRGRLLCLGLPRVWGGGADGGTCHTQARAQGGSSLMGAQRTVGSWRAQRPRRLGKNTSQPQRTGKWRAYPSRGELLCNSKAPLSPHPVTLACRLNTDNCRAPRQG